MRVRKCRPAEADIRHPALPVSFAVRAVADGVEDHASMAPRVVEKASEIVGHLRWLIAIELMVAAQALDLRRVRLGDPMQKAYDTVGAAVPMLREGRATGPDIGRIRALIDQGSLGASAPHAVAVGIE